MNTLSTNPMNERVIFLLMIIAVICCGVVVMFRRYTGLARESAYLAAIASLIAAGARIYFTQKALEHLRSEDAARIAVPSGVFIIFFAAFILRLWGRWIGEKATIEERQVGAPGIRAWFSASNVSVGVVLVVTAWTGYDIPPLVGAIGVALVLAAYPIIRMESPAAAPAPVTEDLSAEREKIVSMIEGGKLTAEEGAELLQALGVSSQRPQRQVPLTGNQRLMLIGAALVAVGFFLPWFVVNPGKEASRMFQQTSVSMNASINGESIHMPASFPFGEGQLNTPTITFAGGDIQRGLGWATLFFALAAALLPYVATSLDAATARTARLLCLSTGGFLVLYLVTQNVRFVGVGLVVAVAGYALEIAGAMRERKAARI